MRVKTEDKRQTILKVASEVFEAQGFEGASMAQIAARVGGSKGTLYGYFASKEELFLEVMLVLAQQHKQHLECFNSTDANLRDTLIGYGEAYLGFITKPFIIEMYRTIIGFKSNTPARRQFYEKGPQKGLLRIAGILEPAVADGRLVSADTTLMAFQFKALLDARIIQPLLLDAMPPPPPADIKTHVAHAADCFLKIYATGK